MAEEKFRFQVTVITKTWEDPADRDKGINVQTQYDYVHDRKEAEAIIKRLVDAVPDAIQAIGFYTKINVVHQYLEA